VDDRLLDRKHRAIDVARVEQLPSRAHGLVMRFRGVPAANHRAAAAIGDLLGLIGGVDHQPVADDAGRVVVDVVVVVRGDQEHAAPFEAPRALVQPEDRNLAGLVLVAVGGDDDLVALYQHLVVPVGTRRPAVPVAPVHVHAIGQPHRRIMQRKDAPVLQHQQVLADLLDDVAFVDPGDLDVGDRGGGDPAPRYHDPDLRELLARAELRIDALGLGHVRLRHDDLREARLGLRAAPPAARSAPLALNPVYLAQVAYERLFAGEGRELGRGEPFEVAVLESRYRFLCRGGRGESQSNRSETCTVQCAKSHGAPSSPRT